MEIDLFNIAVPVGLGLGSGGLISGIVTSILSPNVPGIDRQIKTLRGRLMPWARGRCRESQPPEIPCFAATLDGTKNAIGHELQK